ncbi:MAG: CPBP family intramembrane metalloprotease [Lactobacillaceae bacterium]|jgi:membrane protease YdiL (CAAX protease family)|nr:CPBP family intramembrane metalloprotease [Lactobacillaceae bacterium]
MIVRKQPTIKLVFNGFFIALMNFLLMTTGQVIGQILAVIPFSFLVPKQDGMSFYLYSAYSSNYIAKLPEYTLVSTVLGEGLALLFVWLVAHFVFGIRLRHIFRNTKEALKITWPIIIFIIPNLLSYGSNIAEDGFSFKYLVYGIIIGTSVAIFEEYSNRAVLVNYFQRRKADNLNYFYIALMSGVFFGVMHLINLLQASASNTVLQVIYASGIGILFGAIYLRTKNLFVPILAHAIIDASAYASAPKQALSTGNSNPELFTWIFYVGVTIFYLVYVWMTIRSTKKQEQITKLWNEDFQSTNVE